MKLIKSSARLTRLMTALQLKGKSIGFVPTMGALHMGHLSLVKTAANENDVVVVSIFVNPTQFGPREDFKKYPRNLEKDMKLLKSVGTDFVFSPTPSQIYPKGFSAFIQPGLLAQTLCGPKRPGHFRGVVTVVKRLFDIVHPTRAYFGMKDFQQARIIQDMVKRLKLPVSIKLHPIVREKDGLAMSSRNAYLSAKERLRAKVVPASLVYARHLIKKGEIRPKRLEQKLHAFLTPFVDKVDYAKVVRTDTLREAKRFKGGLLIAIAVYIGRTRLIDNLRLKL